MTRDGDDGPVLEGGNVTLICRANLFSLLPKWAFYKTNNDTHPIYIDESMSPLLLGKFKGTNEEQTEFQLILLDFLLTDDIKIVTENSTFRGEDQPIYKRFLELRNVSKNSPTTFQCMDRNINATRTSVERAPILSFDVLGITKSI